MTMELAEAANRLRILAEAFHGNRIETDNDALIGHRFEWNEDRGYLVSRRELEAVTVAAAILGMFAEALEDHV